MKINAQALMDMASESERRGVRMRDWFICDRQAGEESCGTVGCLVGTYLVTHSDVCRQIRLPWHIGRYQKSMEKHFGVSRNEWKWLFEGSLVNRVSFYEQHEWLKDVPTELAVRRLRRFIYFKLKQAEIHEAWNERQHTKHAQAENTNHVAELAAAP